MLRLSQLACVVTAVLLAGVDPAAAQDANPAFLTKCSAEQWALTFDDGPSPFTSRLLEILADNEVPATFFVVGKQLEQQDFARWTKAAFDAGHMIASHTYDHSDLNTLSPEAIKEQMTRNEALIKKTIGKKPNYMRPPFGNCNAACAGVMKKLGYTVTNWNVDSNDWRYVDNPNPAAVLKVFEDADASVGHVSLQHDIHQFSVETVPSIIAAVKAKGFTFVTVDKCGKVPAYDAKSAKSRASPSGVPTATKAPQLRGDNGAAALSSSAWLGVSASAAAACLHL